MENKIIQACQLRVGMVFRRTSGFLPRVALSIEWDALAKKFDVMYMRRDGSIDSWYYDSDCPLVLYGGW